MRNKLLREGVDGGRDRLLRERVRAGGGTARHLHVEDGELGGDEVVPRDEFVTHVGEGSHVRLDPERAEDPRASRAR